MRRNRGPSTWNWPRKRLECHEATSSWVSLRKAWRLRGSLSVQSMVWRQTRTQNFSAPLALERERLKVIKDSSSSCCCITNWSRITFAPDDGFVVVGELVAASDVLCNPPIRRSRRFHDGLFIVPGWWRNQGKLALRLVASTLFIFKDALQIHQHSGAPT